MYWSHCETFSRVYPPAVDMTYYLDTHLVHWRCLYPNQPHMTFSIATWSLSTLGVGGNVSSSHLAHVTHCERPVGGDINSICWRPPQVEPLLEEGKCLSSLFVQSHVQLLSGALYLPVLGSERYPVTHLLCFPSLLLSFIWAVERRATNTCLPILIILCVFQKDHSSRVDGCQPPALLFDTKGCLLFMYYLHTVEDICLLAFDMKISNS